MAAAVLFDGMRVVVIGGTGHVGTYLVPCLVYAGHETVVVSRGSRRPYRDDAAWRDVWLRVQVVSGWCVSSCWR